jgi:hypothetical protein
MKRSIHTQLRIAADPIRRASVVEKLRAAWVR